MVDDLGRSMILYLKVKLNSFDKYSKERFNNLIKEKKKKKKKKNLFKIILT